MADYDGDLMSGGNCAFQQMTTPPFKVGMTLAYSQWLNFSLGRKIITFNLRSQWLVNRLGPAAQFGILVDENGVELLNGRNLWDRKRYNFPWKRQRLVGIQTYDQHGLPFAFVVSPGEVTLANDQEFLAARRQALDTTTGREIQIRNKLGEVGMVSYFQVSSIYEDGRGVIPWLTGIDNRVERTQIVARFKPGFITSAMPNGNQITLYYDGTVMDIDDAFRLVCEVFEWEEAFPT